MKLPGFTQIRPAAPELARVERNVATAWEQLGQLLNGGLGLDNAAGRLLWVEAVAVPLTSTVKFTLGRRQKEPVSVTLVRAESSDGARYSGGTVGWSWSVEQEVGTVLVSSLPADIPAGTYTLAVFAALP